MRVWCCWQSILNVLLFNLPLYLSDSRKGPTSGPYRSVIESITKCEAPARPYMKDPPITFTVSMYNSSTAILLSGNVTVTRDIKNVKTRLKSSLWENNKWKTIHLMNDLGCHGTMLHVLLKATSVNFDRKNCMFLKGSYFFKNLDVNFIHHLWSNNEEYGKVLWRSDVFNPQLGTFFCYEFIMVTEPA